MRSIGWHDVNCTTTTGIREVRGQAIMIFPEHIERWKSDPDARFELDGPVHGNPLAMLGTFYPSS